MRNIGTRETTVGKNDPRRGRRRSSGRTDGGYLVRNVGPSRAQRRHERAVHLVPRGWIIVGMGSDGKPVMRKATGSVVPRSVARRRRRLARASRKANR